MSDAKKDITFLLKATVNRKKGKVLFAQVDSAFADVLLSFLTLPLGTIVKTLKKHHEDVLQEFGSLTSLYTGLANLDSVHFWGGEGAKSILLHPKSSFDADRQRLKLDISDSPPLEYFDCPKKCRSFARFKSISMYYDKPEYCRYCGSSPMNREVAKNEVQTAPCDDGVFMKKTSSFLLTDDLYIMPNAGLLQIARVLGDIDMDEAETLNVTFELHEVLRLLMFSLISKNPLSIIILNAHLEYKKVTEFTENVSNYNSKKMNLKLVVQKSTKKLLYAEAEEDFVDFLFSFLIIPLCRVKYLLLRMFPNSRDKAIDNLFMSAIDCIHDKYYKHPDAKNWLMTLNIRHGYILKNHILPLTEEELPEIYRNVDWLRSTNFPNGQGNYLIGPRTYKVTDDLTVTPFCIVSILSNLNENNIPMSDVEEVELQIRLKEGLSILKASLTSKCALTDALLSQVMNRQPTREQG